MPLRYRKKGHHAIHLAHYYPIVPSIPFRGDPTTPCYKRQPVAAMSTPKTDREKKNRGKTYRYRRKAYRRPRYMYIVEDRNL